ncbi:MAG: membrane protein insertion efficiency factor YidD [Chlamydiales bacterium]|nr:membrane protein insertion efficiency factor YidD [Chlamydiales bacterium]
MKLIISLLTCSLFFFPLNGNYNESFSEPWGIDSEIAYTKIEKTQAQKPRTYATRSLCKAMIRFFQDYISPIDGPRSSFYPTSSQYALEAIQKYGVFRGISMGCDRLMRENSESWVYDRTDRYGIERKLDPVR